MSMGRKVSEPLILTSFRRGSKTVYYADGASQNYVEEDNSGVTLVKEDGTFLEASYIGPAFKKMLDANDA